MKFGSATSLVLLLSLCCIAHAQRQTFLQRFFGMFGGLMRPMRGSSSNPAPEPPMTNPPATAPPVTNPPANQQQQTNDVGTSMLYLSWRDLSLGRGRSGQRSWAAANSICRSRGQQLVSILTSEKNQRLIQLLEADNVPYTWTSGSRVSGGRFTWAMGVPLGFTNWSVHGFTSRPQPDDREGDENCLAILNKFYPGDGVTWHDIHCRYTKPFICE